MWLYVPMTSRSSNSAPGPECSAKASDLPFELAASDPKLWVTSSAMPKRRPASWRGWDRRRCVRLLFGTIFAPSTAARGADAWISAVRATRASRSRRAADAVRTAIRATFGRPCVDSLRALSPASCSLKTSTRTCALVLGRSSAISSDLATRLRRDSSRRRKRARAISDGGCSSWPTATASDAYGNTAGGARGNPSLGSLVKNWPTPLARDGKVSEKRQRDGGSALSWHAEHYPITLPDETTSELGRLLRSWTPPECPRLNPRFAEWLMGWPQELTSFGLSAREWTRWWRDTLFCLLQLVFCSTKEEGRHDEREKPDDYSS